MHASLDYARTVEYLLAVDIKTHAKEHIDIIKQTYKYI